MSHLRTELHYYTLSQHIITEYAGYSGIRMIVAEPRYDGPYSSETDPDSSLDESPIEVIVSYDTQIWDEDDASPFALMHLTTAGLPELCLNNTDSWSACFEAPKIHYKFRCQTWEHMAFALPNFLRQILSPDFSVQAFAIHVHRVNQDGESVGAAYEYLAKDSETDGLVHPDYFMKTEALRLLYANKQGRFARGNTTLLSNLKEFVNPDGIRDLLHQTINMPQNWTIAVISHIPFDVSELLGYLGDFDIDLEYRGIGSTESKPLRSGLHLQAKQQEPNNPASQIGLTESVFKTITLPQSSTSGNYTIGFSAPLQGLDLEQRIAGEILLHHMEQVLSHLMATSASKVIGRFDEWQQTATAMLQFSDVDPNDLADLEKRVIQIVTTPELWDDLARDIRPIIGRAGADRWITKRELRYCIERECQYGERRGHSLKQVLSLGNSAMLSILMSWSEDQWQDLLRQWFCEENFISLCGKPPVPTPQNNVLTMMRLLPKMRLGFRNWSARNTPQAKERPGNGEDDVVAF